MDLGRRRNGDDGQGGGTSPATGAVPAGAPLPAARPDTPLGNTGPGRERSRAQLRALGAPDAQLALGDPAGDGLIYRRGASRNSHRQHLVETPGGERLKDRAAATAAWIGSQRTTTGRAAWSSSACWGPSTSSRSCRRCASSGPCLAPTACCPCRGSSEAVPFRAAPSIFHLHSSDRFAMALGCTGVALALAAVLGLPEQGTLWLSMLVWLALWTLYLSFVNVGQAFYGFVWGTLLLEAGFPGHLPGQRPHGSASGGDTPHPLAGDPPGAGSRVDQAATRPGVA